MPTSQEERNTSKLDRAEQIKEDDDDLPDLVTDSDPEDNEDDEDDDDLPELVTDSDPEDNKRPELGTGKEDNKPKPAPRRARPARPPRELKPRELKLPKLPTGKPPIPEGSDKNPRRRFTQGPVALREVPTYKFRLIPPVHPSAPAAVDHF
jgi:hypothetical protein